MSSYSDPLGSILMTLLTHATRQGAEQIRIDAGSPRHGSQVFFLIGGEWREQMIIPKHIRASLIERFKNLRGAEDSFSVRLPNNGANCEMFFDIHLVLPSAEGEDVLLQLEPEFPELRLE